jgi:rhodanese-related sulfurtransferase
MKISFQDSLRETVLLILAATLLGFMYTFFMHKGMFEPQKKTVSAISKIVPPEFISFEEALEFFKTNNALFVDARHDFDYKLGHIAGAINVPLKNFDLATSALARSAKDKTIITYCDGAECNSSIELAKKLSEAGFTDVKMFFGGWTEWQQRHQRTEQ